MFWIYGCGLVGVVIAIIETTNIVSDGWYSGLIMVIMLYAFAIVLGAFIGGLIGWGIAWLCGRTVKYEEKTYTINLVSLERDSRVSGRFYLGIGSIDSQPWYFFYVDLGNNTFQLKDASAENTIIQEVDEKTSGELEVTKEVPIGNMKLQKIFTSGVGSRNYRRKFIIPSGSIKRDFNP